jgi:hypothetical protein
MIQFWRLSDACDDNLGLACTDDGLLLGRTLLIERCDGQFVVRNRSEIERLLCRIDQNGLAVDRLIPGLALVASAMNANDPCLARIAAVHLRIPDLPHHTARDAMEAEDALIKSADWNPALHPRTGTPPNAGWFTPTDGSTGDSSPIRVAQNDNPAQRSNGQGLDAWGRPETLGDHLERHGNDFGVHTPEEILECIRPKNMSRSLRNSSTMHSTIQIPKSALTWTEEL